MRKKRARINSVVMDQNYYHEHKLRVGDSTCQLDTPEKRESQLKGLLPSESLCTCLWDTSLWEDPSHCGRHHSYAGGPESKPVMSTPPFLLQSPALSFCLGFT